MRGVYTFHEHEPLVGLANEDLADLKEFARRVLKRKDGDLAASNHVGVITTKRGTVVEILPKIDVRVEAGDNDDEVRRRLFLRMLRCWRRLGEILPESGIRAMRRLPMLEVFVQRFLADLTALARGGLARRYVAVEENLPFLRGRIVFQEHLRLNLVNQARFHVAYDELGVNRPANRLIRSTLNRLLPEVLSDGNRRSVRELLVSFAGVPHSADVHDDWRKHQVDRSMQHYRAVMRWVGLFLFNHGLATFSGNHANISLLFPMEQVFEEFLVHSFRRYQNDFAVMRQGPQRPLAQIAGRGAFMMMPDISLRAGNRVAFVLDAKWKQLDERDDSPRHGIDQSDMYQLYAYAKAYDCKVVALLYPRTRTFTAPLHYRFFDDTRLIGVPFDVQDPKRSVRTSLQAMQAFHDFKG